VLVFELPRGGDQADDVEHLSLRLVQSIPRFAKDGKVKFFLAEPPDKGADSLAGLKYETGSSGGVARDAFKALHPLGSRTFTKVETGRVDTLDLEPDEGGRRNLRGRIKAGGTLVIVAVPEDAEVAATYFGAGAEPEANRPQFVIESEIGK
jgi:hypothetical protein